MKLRKLALASLMCIGLITPTATQSYIGDVGGVMMGMAAIIASPVLIYVTAMPLSCWKIYFEQKRQAIANNPILQQLGHIKPAIDKLTAESSQDAISQVNNSLHEFETSNVNNTTAIQKYSNSVKPKWRDVLSAYKLLPEHNQNIPANDQYLPGIKHDRIGKMKTATDQFVNDLRQETSTLEGNERSNLIGSIVSSVPLALLVAGVCNAVYSSR